MKKNPSELRSGQALLISMLTLGGAILGATAIAGFLTLYQIRGATDATYSAKAIFAADAGANWSLYNHQKGAGLPQPTFSDGITTLTVTCRDIFQNAIGSVCDDAVTVPIYGGATSSDAITVGDAAGAKRAFGLHFDTSVTSFP